jgi:hypothetical protein
MPSVQKENQVSDEIPKLKKMLYDQEPLWMKRKREGQKTMTAGQSFYAPHKRRNHPGEEVFPQGKYPYYCALVLEAALELNPSIRPQYIEIVRAIARPGIQEYRQELMFLQPGRLIAASKSLDERYAHHPELKDEDIDTLNNAADNFLAKYVNNPDFVFHRQCVDRFILTGFNYSEWIEPRILADTSKFLSWAVAVRSAMDAENVTFTQLDQQLRFTSAISFAQNLFVSWRCSGEISTSTIRNVMTGWFLSDLGIFSFVLGVLRGDF